MTRASGIHVGAHAGTVAATTAAAAAAAGAFSFWRHNCEAVQRAKRIQMGAMDSGWRISRVHSTRQARSAPFAEFHGLFKDLDRILGLDLIRSTIPFGQSTPHPNEFLTHPQGRP